MKLKLNLLSFLREALTEVTYEQKGKSKKVERVERPPTNTLLYGMLFAIVSIILLTVLEVVHMIFLGSFNEPVLNVISGLIGTVVGVFLAKKG